jgi:hypothetical protein
MTDKRLLTEDELREIAERAEKAPYGPLESRKATIYGNSGGTDCYGVYKAEYTSYAFAYAETKENADFIANAPEDIKRLLAHADAQQAEIERMKTALERICGDEPDSLHDAQLIAEGAL